MIITDSKTFGLLVRKCRKQQKVTQAQLAAVSNVGLRFVSELENGKPTSQLDKALRVANMAGLTLAASDKNAPFAKPKQRIKANT